MKILKSNFSDTSYNLTFVQFQALYVCISCGFDDCLKKRVGESEFKLVLIWSLISAVSHTTKQQVGGLLISNVGKMQVL